ncbi:MAG: dTDP-4-dehydrorhamnose reductase [Chloroflexota bacterium]
MPNVLVTGGKGMLGADLCQLFEARGHTVHVTDVDNLDIRDYQSVLSLVENIKPDWIMHLAAMTHVDQCEQKPDEAYLTNALGTQNVALAAQKVDAMMVYVSTVSVFDGIKPFPYTEFDTPNPQSVYSKSKLEGERIVRDLLDKFYIVRAGWMFGGGREDKKFVAKIIELAQERDSLSVVNDKFGSPTFTYDIADGIEKLANTGLYGTYHLVNSGELCSRYEFAKTIIQIAGITTCEIHPVNSAQFPLPAPRPRMEAAQNYALELRGLNWQRNWHDALTEYIKTVLKYE